MRADAILRLLIFALAATTAAAQDVSPPEERYLTIGPDGRTLVREVRNTTLVAGENRLRVYDFSPRLDPRSVQVRDLGAPRRVRLRSQSLWFEILDVDRVLESLVGREVTLYREFGMTREQIVGNLLAPPLTATPKGERHVPLFVQQPTGEIRMIQGSQLDLDLDELPRGEWNRERLDWILDSTTAGPSRLELLYWTEGLGFEHSYQLRLSADSTRADLTGLASIRNETGAAFLDCTVQLAAAGGPTRAFHATDPALRATPNVFPVAQPLDLELRRERQVVFVSGQDLEVRSRPTLFPDGEELPAGNRVPVRRRLVLANTAAGRLGQAMPAGPVEVVQVDDANRPVLLHRSTLPETAVGEPLWIGADVVPGIVGQRSSSLQSGEHGPRRLIRVQLQGERDATLEVDVLERLAIGETIQSASVTPDLGRPGWAVLPVQVPPHGSATLTYTVEFE